MSGKNGGIPPDKSNDDMDVVIVTPDEENLSNTTQNKEGQTSQECDRNKNAESKKSNRYHIEDSGPYLIFVEHNRLNVGNLHPLRLGYKLESLIEYDPYIKEISSVGRNRVKIEVTSPVIANKLVEHDLFSNNDLIAYIPQHCIEKKGVIRFVDTFLTNDQLLTRIKSQISVVNVRRVTRLANKNDKQSEIIPTQTVIVTFRGTEVPQYVFINKVRYEVQQYIAPVIQCFRCLLYGHTSKQCRSKESKCHKCGSVHQGSCADLIDVFCIHCKSSDHNSTSKNCPVFEKQSNIKKTMAKYNLSFKEAEKVYQNPSYANTIKSNRFAPLIDSDTEFPPLSNDLRHNKVNKFSNIPSSSRTPNGTNYTNKKRKISVRSPQIQPPQREFPFSFCGNPITHNPHASNQNQDSVDDIKMLLINGVVGLVKHICSMAGVRNNELEKFEVDIENSIHGLFKNFNNT